MATGIFFSRGYAIADCVCSIPLSKAIPVRKLWRFRVCS